ncbi:MAG: ABC transporter ATP-binding protein [Epsilonproteobacteria bacterium]|nr:ABC transporter ATP-binding protein [Campylobacterota bacterium]OIO17927.1 MAG: macrolide ABC transporter ATP-binding protein [Helicobacteraceae bacterium CG1_02_36_14]PIP09333.1 MAG: macrolide ABC transporter ATP-binding protein [Sulfurimonas sp. CG23_combo_of_CG06-09_8_20_14_all_36_33]PIS24386.1 MAG: macrolide ABC transporter ATP-binding protein [Sulfurimonas sp. CG08_land_8_20_14_0_20_36_33]PIU34471.1 MAG: macrolide ABC transporter ATP-binding protein [Sulfurimonas sp. CG07_land_8_20_14_0
MIQLQNVHKYFFKDEPREVHALNDINLTIEDGEFTLFSGPSGCGKTTLLNAIGALDSIESGKIFFNDKEISSLSEEERTTIRLNEMGFVFQAYNLVPVLSVEENIGFIMKLRGFSDTQIRERVLEVASMLEIENKLSSLPHALSGGQQQRVAVARAVAAKPKVILADEPTANLDSKNSKALMDMMRDLNEKEGVSILFASHDEYILKSVRRVVKLSDGALL